MVDIPTMGTWGTGIFDSDDACDIRDDYRFQIEDGVDDAEALRSTLESCRSVLDHPDFGPASIIALAVTMSKIGRLDPAVRDRALAAIDSGADLAMWAEEDPKSVPKRRAALEKARAQLVGPQPKRKRLRPPRRELCGLVAGDGLALSVPSGLALLRVVRVDPFRMGGTPTLEELKFRGGQLPAQEELDRLKPRAKGTIALMGEPHFNAFVANDKIGWEQAGFKKVATFAPRPGDEAVRADSGSAWSSIARLRRTKD